MKSISDDDLERVICGTVTLLRGFCEKCGEHVLVPEDRFCCCGTEITGQIGRLRQVVPPRVNNRGRLSQEVKSQLVKEQRGKCFWCYRPFGSLILKKNGKTVQLTVAYDHVIPFCHTQSCQDQEFVAACHICNSLKKDYMFEDEEACRGVLRRLWQKKEYQDI